MKKAEQSSRKAKLGMHLDPASPQQSGARGTGQLEHGGARQGRHTRYRTDGKLIYGSTARNIERDAINAEFSSSHDASGLGNGRSTIDEQATDVLGQIVTDCRPRFTDTYTASTIDPLSPIDGIARTTLLLAQENEAPVSHSLAEFGKHSAQEEHQGNYDTRVESTHQRLSVHARNHRDLQSGFIGHLESNAQDDGRAQRGSLGWPVCTLVPFWIFQFIFVNRTIHGTQLATRKADCTIDSYPHQPTLACCPPR